MLREREFTKVVKGRKREEIALRKKCPTRCASGFEKYFSPRSICPPQLSILGVLRTHYAPSVLPDAAFGTYRT